MLGGEGDCSVVVVGAGAAGALTASHLVTSLSPRYRVTLVDPAPTTGRGTAYSTTDERHLLNVPASGMSAFPRDPEHFFRWVRNHHDSSTQPQDFVPRRVYGDYVSSLLETAAEYPGNARLERRTDSVAGIDRRGEGFVVRLDSGQSIVARAVVLATGASASTDWAPPELEDTGRLVADPWRQELPDGDLLLVGTGLTMVDIAIAADRPGRVLHTVSRHDKVPAAHRIPTTPAVPPPPGITRVGSLDELQRLVRGHVEQTVAETGDWRAALDGLRPVTAQLWQGLDEDDKRQFLTECARTWDVHRHRMPPITAQRLDAIAEAGRLVRHTGTVAGARRSGTGVEVTLTDGQLVTVAGVVNCTGPVGTVAKDPLLVTLARTGLVRPGPSGLGIDTADDGRVLGVLPSSLPLYALGALRRGNLWETTAMPEIREQAYDVARAVVRALHGETRRRPVDAYGLTLTTDAGPPRPTTARSDGCSACRTGSRPGWSQPWPSTRDSPRRTLPWPCSATSGVPPVPGALRFGQRTPRRPTTTSTTARSASSTPSRSGCARTSPPVRPRCSGTSASSRATPWPSASPYRPSPSAASPPVGQTAASGRGPGAHLWRRLVVRRAAGLRPPGPGTLERGRALSSYALSVEPSSGHAAHARAHVFYETGQHAAGLAWLDEWISARGPEANHRSHFSWHAALHELMQDDVEAVRRRYERELAPPLVTGSRALVDSGALLWRCHVTETWEGPLPERRKVCDSPPTAG